MMNRTQWLKWLRRSGALFSVVFASLGSLILCDGLTDEIAVADIAVVLGNRVEKDGTPSDRLKARLDKAIELYNKGLFPKILVSGGTGKEGYDEAKSMHAYLMEHGIPETNILVDSNGRNTYHTAKKSAQLMAQHGWKSAMVISQYFHLSRSKLAMLRFGVPEVYSAHADYYEMRDLYSLGREVTAYGYYLFRRYQE